MRSKSTSKAHAAPIAEGSDLSRQLLTVQEEERRRISRELHDETGQGLMVLRFHLEMIATEASDEQQKARLLESLELLDRTIEGLRRTIARLSPRVLEELGLVAAIRRQAELVERHTAIKARLDLPEDLRILDHGLEVALYRSVQEALHNVAKHSQARNFNIRLAATGDRVSLQIEDDGVGFSPQVARERGFGLTGMRERAVALGGSMRIRSDGAKGTRIRLVFPLADQTREHSHGGRRPLERITAA